MRFISTHVHGMLDYIWGLLLIASPWLLNFNYGGAETSIPIIIGVSVILMSLLTDYEMGLAKIFSINFHLIMDVAIGAFLAASPWLFGFKDYVVAPHLVFGIFAMAAGLMTVHSPSVHHLQHENVRNK
jgi:hypothetical protein